ncbi:hypothetical protein [Actinoplanes sp. NPDC051859]|uniref:hypothetical protein n=1 Tax=Actinoplanes sp. NPDC051859 TaxID=3363909 RepID=UPI0037AC4393
MNITPPTEGSLDEASLSALVDALARASGVGPDTSCFAFYGSVPANEYDRPTLFRGPLAAIQELVGSKAFQASPSNIWPADRSWFVWTDWDLWASKVSGSPTLMAALRDHPDLETITWPPGSQWV